MDPIIDHGLVDHWASSCEAIPGHTWTPSGGGWSAQGSSDSSPARQHGALLSEEQTGERKENRVCCDIMIHYLPHCKDFYAWTASLRQAARRNSILKLLYKRQMKDSGLCRSLPLSVCMCEGLSFSLRCCLGDKTHSCILSPFIWYAVLGMEGESWRGGGGGTGRKRWGEREGWRVRGKKLDGRKGEEEVGKGLREKYSGKRDKLRG